MIDLTPLYHGLIAAAFWLIGWLCGEPLAGAAMGAGIFIGREHARVEMPWWGGFYYRVWDWASLLDIIVPMAPLITAYWRIKWPPTF